MSGIIQHTGFETGNLGSEWIVTDATQPISQAIATDQVHSGLYSLKLDFGAGDAWRFNASIGLQSNIGDPGAAGIAFRVANLADIAMFAIGLTNGGLTLSTFICLYIHEDGSAELRRGTSVSEAGTQIGSALAPGTFVNNTWYYVEVEVSVGGGTAKVFIDGSLVISFTGDIDDSTGGPNGFCGGICEIVGAAGAAAGPVWLDDFYFAEDTTGQNAPAALGPVYHEALVPTSSIEADGVGSDGNSVDNHLLLDEVPGSSADYVTVSTVGGRERYGLSNRTHTGIIHAVSIWGQVAATGQGSVLALGFVDSNGTEQGGSGVPVTVTPRTALLYGPLDDDPATYTEPWVTAGVNALTAGFRVIG